MLLPVVSQAAGLGKLTVLSALGQPFHAEIDILSATADDIPSLTIRMASAEAFKQAKLERNPLIGSLRMSVEQRKNGKAYVKLTSVQIINEPFLDLLIEFNWPSGRLVREYTVLLDPPEEVRKAPQVTAPVAKPAAAPAPAPTPAPAAEAKPAAKPVAAVPAVATEKKEGGAENTYGPVKKGDTLSNIARQVKPEGASLEQMLVALFQSNKGAFDGKNMNRLKVGQILRVPEAAEVGSTDDKMAAKEVRAHVADWNAYRQKLASAVAEAPAPKDEGAKQAASGKITAAVEDKGAQAKEPGKDVLKLSKGDPGKGGKDAKAVQDRIAALQEENAARDKTLKEANSRISDLEKMIKDMKQSLELKNQELARLQGQAAAKPAPAATPAPVAPVQPAPAAKPAEPAPPAAPPAPAPAAEKKAETPVAAPEKQPVPAATPVAKPEAKPEAAKPKVAPPPPPEPSLMEELLDPLYIGILVVILGIGGGAFFVMKKRKERLAKFEDSIISGGDFKANTVIGSTGGGEINTGDTSFLTDFSQAGMGTIDTNDVDPIAEAEVYMAYGRDAQAEEILKEAMAKDSQRFEVQGKLLEIYATRKDLNSFETLAAELYAAIGNPQHPVWVKVAQLGQEMDAGNPLYKVDAEAAPSAADKTMVLGTAAAAGLAAAAAGEAAELDLDFNLGGTEPAEAALETAEAAPAADLDINLGGTTAAAEEPAAEAAGLDFNLGDSVMPAATAEAVAPQPAEEAALDFDLGMVTGGVEATQPAAETVPAADEGLGMDFDLGALSTAVPEAPVASEAPAEAAAAEVSMDFDLGSLGGAEPATEAAAEPEAVSMDFDLGSLGGTIEAEEAPAVMDVSLELPDLGGSEDVEASPAPAADLDLNIDLASLGAPMVEAAPAPEEPAMPEFDLSGIDLSLDTAAELAEAVAVPAGLDDEVATKLDLARAYVEMGDAEGAREILNEVAKEGNADQQAEAKKMLAAL